MLARGAAPLRHRQAQAKEKKRNHRKEI